MSLCCTRQSAKDLPLCSSTTLVISISFTSSKTKVANHLELCICFCDLMAAISSGPMSQNWLPVHTSLASTWKVIVPVSVRSHQRLYRKSSLPYRCIQVSMSGMASSCAATRTHKRNITKLMLVRGLRVLLIFLALLFIFFCCILEEKAEGRGSKCLSLYSKWFRTRSL